MDYKKKYCYVCEGKTDEDRLKKAGCLFVVVSGGKFIRPEILSFLSLVSKKRNIVLVTDPDTPGDMIRKKIESVVGPCINLHGKKEQATYNGKLGIAEMRQTSVDALLASCIEHDKAIEEESGFSHDDYLDMGLEGLGSKERRERLIKKYSLPLASGKNVEEECHILSLTKEEIKEAIAHD